MRLGAPILATCDCTVVRIQRDRRDQRLGRVRRSGAGAGGDDPARGDVVQVAACALPAPLPVAAGFTLHVDGSTRRQTLRDTVSLAAVVGDSPAGHEAGIGQFPRKFRPGCDGAAGRGRRRDDRLRTRASRPGFPGRQDRARLRPPLRSLGRDPCKPPVAGSGGGARQGLYPRSVRPEPTATQQDKKS